MSLKGKKSFYERQLELWEKECEKHPIGSPEYVKAYSMIGKIHQDMKDKMINDSIEWKKIDVISKSVLGVGGLILSVAKLVQYWNTAKMAYDHNKRLETKDGEVWKLKDDLDKIKI